MAKGIRDQRSDFNKPVEEAVPASWAIETKGRPTAAAAAAAEPEEPAEDAVCMVCFNGVSDDINCILFCDGCNAALHQACYGVGEIPEGDFFCERCRTVTEMCENPQIDFSYGDCARGVMCCLCPLQHGGLKATTDGRWVHLCCATWAGSGSLITDLDEMGPVDVSGVPVQGVVDPNSRTNRLQGRAPSSSSGNPQHMSDAGADEGGPANTATTEAVVTTGGSANYPHTEACVYCKVLGGLLLSCCSGIKGGTQRCSTVFHPLCAWFAGAYVETTVTDVTFQASERGGNYPAGLTFAFYCSDHAPGAASSADVRATQKKLRGKYRIKDDDLEGMPGKKRHYRRAYTPRAPKPPPPVVKDLNKDAYHRVCGLCIGALHQGGAVKRPAARPTLAAADSGTPAADASSGSSSSSAMDEEGEGEGESKPAAAAVTAASDADADAVVVKMEGEATEPTTSSSSSTSVVPVDKALVTCSTCKVSCHAKCHIKCGGSAMDAGSSLYQCDTCSRSLEDPRCIFCPRRGGLFKPTPDGKWAHAFCANSCPGQTCVRGGMVQQFALPKQAARQKCNICNRKEGFVVRCVALGCNNYFHTLCGEKSGRGYHRVRAGAMSSYCSEHIPEGIERVNSGYFVDGYEACRLRYTLERGRLIVDTLLRREKFKKALARTESDAFTHRFWRLLDKAKGRRFAGTREERVTVEEGDTQGADENGDGSDADNNGSLAETESESDSSSDDDMWDEDIDGMRPYVPKKGPELTFVYGDRAVDEEDEDMVYDSDESEGEHRISGCYSTKKGELKLPRAVAVTLAGLTVTAKDVYSEKSRRAYTNTMMGLMQEQRAEFRSSVGIFEDVDDWDEFARKLPSQVKKWRNQSLTAFTKDMEKNHDMSVTFQEEPEEPEEPEEDSEVGDSDAEDVPSPKKPKSTSKKAAAKPKKVKKGYALVPIDEQETDDDEAMMAVEEVEAVLTPTKKSSKQGAGKTKNNKRARVLTAEEERQLLLERLLEKAAAAKAAAEAAAEASAAAAAASAGPTLTAKELSNVVMLDPLTAAMHACAKSKDGFAGVLARAKIGAVAEAASHDDNVVRTDPASLLALERHIQDILVGIDDYEVEEDDPDEAAAAVRNNNKGGGGSSKKGNDKKKGRSRARKSTAQPMRSPIEDYRAVPYELIPDYDLNVRRAVGFDDIQEKLKMHRYRSLGELSRDFYTMLNNGRIVTKPSSLTWKDSQGLAVLFEQLKLSRAASSSSSSSPQPVHKLDYAVTTKKKTGVDYASKACSQCKKQHYIVGWPWGSGGNKESSSSQGPEPKDKGQWWCPSCVTEKGASLVGKAVSVWWDDDSQFYDGHVNAFESMSGRHRVLYKDGEWTFYDLGYEIAFFAK
jgi:hypothetical protein